MFQDVGVLIDGGDAPRQAAHSNMVPIGGYTEGLALAMLFRDHRLKLVRLRLGKLVVANGNNVVEDCDHALQHRVEHLLIHNHGQISCPRPFPQIRCLHIVTSYVSKIITHPNVIGRN